ncbi:MAG TPA: hypothetical protein VE597_00800, partial [Geminicoccaceae bacterium]|nr:hypothetical protein [Geminicoccaceae bacterium]
MAFPSCEPRARAPLEAATMVLLSYESRRTGRPPGAAAMAFLSYEPRAGAPREAAAMALLSH